MENRNGLKKLKMSLMDLSRSFAKNHFKLLKKSKEGNLQNSKQNRTLQIILIC